MATTGYKICEECGILLELSTFLTKEHTKSIHHPNHVLINKKLRDGWVPIRQDLFYERKAVHKVFDVKLEGSYLQRNSIYNSKTEDLWWIRIDNLKDCIELFTSTPDLQNIKHILYAANHAKLGMPWWQAWSMWNKEYCTQTLKINDTEITVTGFYSEQKLLGENSQKLTLPSAPYCIDYDPYNAGNPYEIKGIHPDRVDVYINRVLNKVEWK